MLIYKITNLINNKVYIGQTIRTLKQRFTQHCCRSDSIVGSAIKKYGKENFSVEIIAETDNLEELNKMEVYYIKEFNSLSPNGYNLDSGGNNKTMHEETKKKIGARHKGKVISEEQKQIASLTHKGKPKSIEQRLKMSIAGKARIRTKEHCENISNSKKGIRAKNNKWVYGFNPKTNQGFFISSAHEAVKLGFNQGHLRECCIGKRRKHRGFIWCYVSDIIK